MLEGQQLEDAIAATPGEKVEMQQILSRIKAKNFMTLEAVGAPTVTVCSILLDNGYSVRGESACVDPANFNEEIGRSLAYRQATDKLWPLFGFLLAEKRHIRAHKSSFATGSAVLLLCALLFSGCSTLFPVEETKYITFPDGGRLRVDLQNGRAFQSNKLYGLQVNGTDAGYMICNKVPSTDSEDCQVVPVSKQ